MAEATPAPQPDQLVHNQDLAWDMAHAQKPYWEDAQKLHNTAEAIGLSETARLVATAAIHEAGVNVVKAIDENWPPSVVAEEVSKSAIPELSPDKVWTAEEVRDFSLKHFATLSTYFNAFKRHLHSPSAVHRVFRQKGREDKLNLLVALGSTMGVNSEESKLFVKAGYSETVTIVPLSELASKDNPDGYRIDPALLEIKGGYVLMYKTNTRISGNDQGVYSDASVQAREERRAAGAKIDSRPGQYVSMNMLIYTKDEAEELEAQIRKNPQMVRDIMETLVLSNELDELNVLKGAHFDASTQDGKLQSGGTVAERWEIDCRPPYERWKEVNGGVSRIALRTNITDGPDKSESLEF